MGIKFSNKASTSLTSGISTSDTTINVANGSVFPTLGANDFFYATLMFLNDASETEIIKVTAVNNNQLTVDRSIETSKAFYANDIIELRVTAQALADPTLLADGIKIEDGHKIQLGDSDDLEIYHDGSNSIIKDNGTGELYIYRGADPKLNTTLEGIHIDGRIDADEIDLTGAIAADSFVTDGTTTDYSLFTRVSSTDPAVYIQSTGEKIASFATGSVLPNGGTEILDVNSTGLDVTGTVTSNGLRLGNNESLQTLKTDDSVALTIYTDATWNHTYIDEAGGGNLVIDADAFVVRDKDGGGQNRRIVATSGNSGSVALYYGSIGNTDSDAKLNTTATGISVNGTVTADGLEINGTVDIDTGTDPAVFRSSDTERQFIIICDSTVDTATPDLVLRREGDVTGSTAGEQNDFFNAGNIRFEAPVNETDTNSNEYTRGMPYAIIQATVVDQAAGLNTRADADAYLAFLVQDGDNTGATKEPSQKLKVYKDGIDVIGTVSSDKLKVDTTTDIKALQIISSHNGSGATPDVSIERSEIHAGTTNSYHSIGNLNFVGKNATYDGISTTFSTGLSSIEYGRIGVVANSHITGGETGRISFNVYDHASAGLISPFNIYHNKVSASKKLEVTGTVTAEDSIEITSSDAGATASPVLALYKDNSNPTVDDIVGAVRFFGNNTGADNKKLMGGIECTYTGSNTSGNSAFEETAKLSFHLPRGDGYIDSTASDNPVTSITGDITGDHVFMELDEQYLTVNTENGFKFNPASSDGVFITMPVQNGTGLIEINNNDTTSAASISIPNTSGTIIVGERDANGNLRLNESYVRDVELAPRTEVISTPHNPSNSSSLVMVKNRKYVNTYTVSSNTFVLPTGTNTGQMLTVVNASNKDLFVDRTTNSITIKKLVAESDPTSITSGNLTVKKGGVVEFVYSGNTEVQCFGSGI